MACALDAQPPALNVSADRFLTEIALLSDLFDAVEAHRFWTARPRLIRLRSCGFHRNLARLPRSQRYCHDRDRLIIEL